MNYPHVAWVTHHAQKDQIPAIAKTHGPTIAIAPPPHVAWVTHHAKKKSDPRDRKDPRPHHRDRPDPVAWVTHPRTIQRCRDRKDPRPHHRDHPPT